MRKKTEFNGKYVTVLPGVQMISKRAYRARVQVNGVSLRKTFTNKKEAHKWYISKKLTSK